MLSILLRLRDLVNTRFPRLRFILAIAAPIAAIWAVGVAQTDGYELMAYGVRIFSTHYPRNPTIIATVCGLTSWLLASADERMHVERRIANTLEHPAVAHAGALILAFGILAIGIAKGAFVAGGSDSYGYVSEAHLLAHGKLRIEQPIMLDASWPFYRPEAFAPLGYRLSVDRAAIVPTYSVGYPLMMAAAERVAGPHAVFYLVPILGSVTILATYALGLAFAGPFVALCGAALMATSPVFLFQLMQPMSDVPVTAWWTLALALLTGGRRWAILAAGLASGLAILTRPNLAPLAAAPTLFLLFVARGDTPRTAATIGRRAIDVGLFVIGPITAAIAVGAFNASLYGSPLLSGYGSLEALFGWRFIRPNTNQYSSWLTMTQTPFLWLFVLAPFAVGRPRDGIRNPARSTMWLWLAFCAINVGCYLPYFAFKFEEWLYLRFLLPAFPLALILATVVTRAGIFRASAIFRTVILLAIVWLVAARNFNFTVERGGLGVARGERKYVVIGEYADQHLPKNAVFFSLSHSGSARYYSGRLTVRFDLIDSGAALEGAIADLRRLGYRPYFLLEPPDESQFKERFAKDTLFGRLAWSPLVTLQEPDATAVKIWDPEQASAAPSTPARP